MLEGRRVHAHEGDECAEIEHLGRQLKGEQEGTDHGQHADKDYVVAGNAALAVDGAEERSRERVVAAHAVKQARRSQLRTAARADGRQQQGEVDELKEPDAAQNVGGRARSRSSLTRDIRESGIHLRERPAIGPYQLGHIDLY